MITFKIIMDHIIHVKFGFDNNLPIEEIAQFVIGLGDVSLVLQKKYATEHSVSDGVVTLGLAVFSVLKKDPRFDEVLVYMRRDS